MQEYERRFQAVVSDYAKLQQEHKQKVADVEVLSKVRSSATHSIMQVQRCECFVNCFGRKWWLGIT